MSESLSRRAFIAGGLGTMVAGSFALNGCASGSASGASNVKWDEETDVVVIGFGGAGASAAIEASDAGVSAIIIEKAPEGQEGGNTSVSGGGFAVNLADYPEYMYAQFPDTVAKEEIDGTIDELKSMRSWLEDHGAKVTDGSGGTINIGGSGYALFTWAKGVAINSPGVTVMYETPAKRLIFDPETKEVFGVVAEKNGTEINIKAKRGVVMACGGFEASHFKLTAYYPPSFPIFPCGTPYNTGDGIDMVQELGAKLRGFGSVEWGCHCCKKGSEEIGVALAHSFLDPDSWSNSIMVNANGKRFANETEASRYPSNFVIRPLHSKEQLPELAMKKVPYLKEDGTALNLTYEYANLPMYQIFGETRRANGKPLFSAAGKGSGNHWASLRGLYTWSDDNKAEIDKGWIIKADTLEELASKTGIDPAGLVATAQKYDAGAAAGVDTEFGRTWELNSIGSGPYYACELALGLINTQGGPVRDAEHHVLGNDGEPIKRLYSGGEFGSIYVWNYPGALNVPEAMSNHVAGANAAAEMPWG